MCISLILGWRSLKYEVNFLEGSHDRSSGENATEPRVQGWQHARQQPESQCCNPGIQSGRLTGEDSSLMETEYAHYSWDTDTALLTTPTVTSQKCKWTPGNKSGLWTWRQTVQTAVEWNLPAAIFFLPLKSTEYLYIDKAITSHNKKTNPHSQGLHRIPRWVAGVSHSIPQAHLLVSLWGSDPFFLEILASHRLPPWSVNAVTFH